MSRWERPATRMSGRHDPTPERARSFQQRVIAADVAAQRPTDQRATMLWQVMHCYGITEDDVRRAAR